MSFFHHPALPRRSADSLVRQRSATPSYTRGQGCPRSGLEVLKESPTKSILILTATLSLAGTLAGCGKHEPTPSEGKPDAAAEKQEESRVSHGANGEVTVTFDAAMQQRIGLKVEALVATNLPPEVAGFARVLDPAPLIALVADLAAAQTTAEASQKELERLQKLRVQDNTSERALQAGEAAASRDKLLVESLRAKLALSWGRAIAGFDKLPELAIGLAKMQAALVRIDLPAGEVLPGKPTGAQLVPLNADAKPISAEFISAAASTDPQLQGQGFLFLVRGEAPAPGAALSARIQTDGTPVSGLLLSADAVVRHENKVWTYVQTADDRFTRREVELGRVCRESYFVTNGLATGEKVVTTGAQLLLSEELKGQGGEE